MMKKHFKFHFCLLNQQNKFINFIMIFGKILHYFREALEQVNLKTNKINGNTSFYVEDLQC